MCVYTGIEIYLRKGIQKEKKSFKTKYVFLFYLQEALYCTMT